MCNKNIFIITGISLVFGIYSIFIIELLKKKLEKLQDKIDNIQFDYEKQDKNQDKNIHILHNKIIKSFNKCHYCKYVNVSSFKKPLEINNIDIVFDDINDEFIDDTKYELINDINDEINDEINDDINDDINDEFDYIFPTCVR
jgi:hypothetical protein